MNHDSTLVSYLHRLLVFLTGSFGKPGTHYVPDDARRLRRPAPRRSDEPGRRRADRQRPRAVQRDRRGDPHRSPEALPRDARRGANPAHSLADSKRMREALALARHARRDRRGDDRDRAARATTCCRRRRSSRRPRRRSSTSTSRENYFHLRPRLLPPPAGPLPEAEIHARLVRGAGRGHRGRSRAAARGRRARARRLRAGAHRARDERSRGSPRSRRSSSIARCRSPTTSREGAVLFGLCAASSRWSTGRRSRAPASRARRSRPATRCSTRCSSARPAWCSRSTSGAR